MKKTLQQYPDILEVNDIKEYLGIGREQAYNLAKSGEFHSVRVGKRILIYKKQFERWLQGEAS